MNGVGPHTHRPTVADGQPALSFADLRARAHPDCFACAPGHPHGLRLTFVPRADGSVCGTFACEAWSEGYPGIVHGGIVAALLDGAMTNCLFARGRVAVTADLHVRFRHPLRTGSPAEVRARLVRDAAPLFVLEAEVVQAGQIRATAVGKFMRPPDALDMGGRGEH